MNPNWHYCGTCGNTVVGNGDLRVKHIDKLRIADVSVLSDIPSANTQIWAYLVAWVAVCGIQKSDKAHPAPNRKGFEAEVRDKEKKKNNQ